VLGVLSLISVPVIVVKPQYLLLRPAADNRGEGGILALMSWCGATSAAGASILVMLDCSALPCFSVTAS